MGGGTPLPGGDGLGSGGGGGQGDGPSKGQGDAADREAGTAPDSPDAGAEAGSADGSGAPKDAKTAKVVNDAAAYIRALADLRGRNADWAEKAVRQAATLTNSEAVARNVADLEAGSVRALLAALDGRTVALETGPVTLDLKDARIERAPPDWRDRLLATLTDPNVAFLLMIIGLYGLIFEFTNPGLAIPGVLGAICLLLGLYALNVLPVNYAGLGLMAVGIAFMVAEAFVPSFGALGLGGLAAFGLGSTILFDTGSGAYELSWWTILGVTVLTGVVLLLLIGMMVRAQRRPVSTGEDTLIGHAAEVVSWQAGRGRVALAGEYWNAVGPDTLEPGQRVQVTGRQGLTLTVAAGAPNRRPQDPTQPAGA
jgi:membrane-bound serine protease (ClpP class)